VRRMRCRGQSMIEFALIFPLFMLLVCGVFDFGRLFYTQLTLQSAVREASRLTVTGNLLPDPESPGDYLNRIDSIIQMVHNMAPGFQFEENGIEIIGPGGAGDPGGPGDLVTIRVTYSVDLLTPLVKPFFTGGKHTFTISMISKNEPFPDTT